jgi:endonuclease/exonuclease/phosphatase family metal-dependent hydrolase
LFGPALQHCAVSLPPRNLLLAITMKSGSIAIASGHLQLLFVQRRMSAITLPQPRGVSVPWIK